MHSLCGNKQLIWLTQVRFIDCHRRNCACGPGSVHFVTDAHMRPVMADIERPITYSVEIHVCMCLTGPFSEFENLYKAHRLCAHTDSQAQPIRVNCPMHDASRSYASNDRMMQALRLFSV